MALFAMPVHAPATGLTSPPTPTAPQHHVEHRGWIYAAIALIAAALVLGGMAAYQYVTTQDTTPATTAVSAIPAEYAGVSLPQAMRLADQAALAATIPAEYAGVSLPQAMRLADQAALAATIPAEYAGVSLPQAMRLADLAAANQ